METLRPRLEERIQKRHMLAHPFYLRWQTGKLSREEMMGYAKEYYSFEKEFPRFLSAIHTRCEDPKMRQQVLENLLHEERGENNHRELWLRFAEGVGVKREEMDTHFHSDETEQLLRVFRKHTQSAHIADGLAALYAYERQQPDVARTKIEGLQTFYGVKDESGVAFFKEHQTVDVYHAETEFQCLAELCRKLGDGTEDRVLAVADEVLDALYDFLDGVGRRYQVLAA
jgi:pyrroloquinoline-quinone synthase